VDRILAFREELSQLEGEGVASLAPDQKAAIASHHDTLLADLAARFDVDTTETLRRMSWGMRIVSLVGALAMSAAVVLFLLRIWGTIGASAQVAILASGPLALLAATEYAARKERTLYFASLLAVLAFACFVLDLNLLGLTFNITPTPNALLAFSAFAFIIAYTYRLPLLLIAALVCLTGFLSATVASWNHHAWLEFGERPENFFLSGFAIFGVGASAAHSGNPHFSSIYRVIGLLGVFLPAILLANTGAPSYLPFAPEGVEVLYQFLGIILGGISVWLGVSVGWQEVVSLGSLFFALFLLMGLLAVGLLIVLLRFRSMTRRVTS
jgi:hypothetical protein